MPLAGKPIEIIRGVSKTLEVTVRDEDKALVDLTGAIVFFTVKRTIASEDEEIGKNSTNPAEATILDQLTNKGKARFFLTPVDTADLEPARDHVYDVWVELASGNRHAIIKPSQFTIKRAVTEDFTP